MDDILEFIFELLAEVIEALATSKSVPLPIRIIAMIIISAAILAIIILCFCLAVNTDSIAGKVVLGIVAAVVIVLFALFQRKWWKSILQK